METTFTPYASFGGGLLIGLASVLAMAVLGRIMGATGLLAGLLVPANREDWVWRLAIILGMISAPLAVMLATGEVPEIAVPVSTAMLVIGGFIVGLGVTYGGGCTSGHGVCGMARFSPRSFVATVSFMVATFVTVFVLRHILGV